MSTRDGRGWLDEGEALLWRGRPSIPLAVARLGLILLLQVGLFYVVYRVVAGTPALDLLLGQVREALRSQPLVVVVPALLLLALPALLLARWIRESHAITDRRLVALRGRGTVSWSLPPDLVLEVRRGRLLGIFDLRFNHTLSRSSDGRTRPTVFHCVSDIAAVAERVRRWHDARQEDVRRSLEDRAFLTSQEGRFSIEVPSSWEVREDEPPSWLLSLLGAGVTEHEEEARLAGLVGERVRHTAMGARHSGPRRHRAVYHFDQWTLPGDERWYRVIAVWSEALPVAGEALREVAETFRPLAGAGAARLGNEGSGPAGQRG